MLIQVVTDCASPYEAWRLTHVAPFERQLEIVLVTSIDHVFNNMLTPHSVSGSLLGTSTSSLKSLCPWMREAMPLPSLQSHLMMGTLI